MPIGVITAASLAIRLVASHEPPIPTSKTPSCTGFSAEPRKAGPRVPLKIGPPALPLPVDHLQVRLEVLPLLGERRVRDVLAAHGESLGQVDEVRRQV